MPDLPQSLLQLYRDVFPKHLYIRSALLLIDENVISPIPETFEEGIHDPQCPIDRFNELNRPRFVDTREPLKILPLKLDRRNVAGVSVCT